MSADNGYVLRKNARGKFVLQSYFASCDFPDVENADPRCETDTLEQAIALYQRLEDTSYPSEYGLTIRI